MISFNRRNYIECRRQAMTLIVKNEVAIALKNSFQMFLRCDAVMRRRLYAHA